MVFTNAWAAASDQDRAAQGEMYRLVGHALSQWADLELKLHLLAIRSLGIEDIYHVSELLDAVISFEAKTKIIGTGVKRNSKSENAIEIWPRLIAYIFKLKKKRDKIAHGIITRKITNPNEFVLLPYISFNTLNVDSFNGAMTFDMLRTCIDHFEEATWVTLVFSAMVLGDEGPHEGIPERALAQLRLFHEQAGLTQAGNQLPPPPSAE